MSPPMYPPTNYAILTPATKSPFKGDLEGLVRVRKRPRLLFKEVRSPGRTIACPGAQASPPAPKANTTLSLAKIQQFSDSTK